MSWSFFMRKITWGWSLTLFVLVVFPWDLFGEEKQDRDLKYFLNHGYEIVDSQQGKIFILQDEKLPDYEEKFFLSEKFNAKEFKNVVIFYKNGNFRNHFVFSYPIYKKVGKDSGIFLSKNSSQGEIFSVVIDYTQVWGRTGPLRFFYQIVNHRLEEVLLVDEESSQERRFRLLKSLKDEYRILNPKNLFQGILGWSCYSEADSGGDHTLVTGFYEFSFFKGKVYTTTLQIRDDCVLGGEKLHLLKSRKDFYKGIFSELAPKKGDFVSNYVVEKNFQRKKIALWIKNWVDLHHKENWKELEKLYSKRLDRYYLKSHWPRKKVLAGKKQYFRKSIKVELQAEQPSISFLENGDAVVMYIKKYKTQRKTKTQQGKLISYLKLGKRNGGYVILQERDLMNF